MKNSLVIEYEMWIDKIVQGCQRKPEKKMKDLAQMLLCHPAT